MESENIPHHPDFRQEQQQQVESASSNSTFNASSAHGSLYGASRYSSDQYAWSPNSNSLMTNASSRTYQNSNALMCNTRRSYIGENDEETHIPWGNNNVRNDTEDHHQRHQTLIPIIHDQSSNKSKLDLYNPNLFPKLTDMISSTHSSAEDLQHGLYPISFTKTDDFQDTKSLMKPTFLSPSGQSQFHASQFISNSHDYLGYEGSTSFPSMPSRGTFSQIFPSVNISNLSNTHLNSMVSSPLDMNVHALDLLTSERFGSGINHDQTQNHAFGRQNLQLSAQRTTTSPSKLPSKLHGGSMTYTKRSQTEPPPSKTTSKKSRSESRACPPFKVRKEKLGDRIAALQQLVAPFGKTDTASVLMEAIGYIKFLQNQVETLSVPYMKSSRTRILNPTRMADQMADLEDKLVESRRDLRSRGLCLVPLSCMSYVTNDDGGGWPSSDYHGGT